MQVVGGFLGLQQGLPLPSPAVSPTHNGQRRGARPVVRFDLGWLVGVGRLRCRELGRLDDEVFNEVLALRAASCGLCRGRSRSARAHPAPEATSHLSPPLPHLSLFTPVSSWV